VKRKLLKLTALTAFSMALGSAVTWVIAYITGTPWTAVVSWWAFLWICGEAARRT